MSYLNRAKEMYAKIDQGQMHQALEEYYHDNVKVIEVPTGQVRNSKAEQREPCKVEKR